MNEENKKKAFNIALEKYANGVQQEGDCLLWTGGMDSGKPFIEVYVDKKRYKFSPRRISVGGGKEYPRLYYTPTCGNPRCVKHLVQHIPDASAWQDERRLIAEQKAKEIAMRRDEKRSEDGRYDQMGFKRPSTQYSPPVRYASVWDYARSGV